MSKGNKSNEPTHAVEVTRVIQTSGVTEQTGLNLQQSFLPFFELLDGMEQEAKSIVVQDEHDTQSMERARQVRLQLRDIRINADKKRKELKENSLREGRAIQGVYNIIEYVVKPLEEHLGKQENYAHEMAKKRMEELKELRTKELEPYSEFVPFGIELGIMDEAEYQKVLNGAKLQLKAKEDAEKAERERLAEEQRINKLRQERLAEVRDDWRFVNPTQKDDDLGTMSPETWERFKSDIQANKEAFEKEQARLREDNERLQKEKEEAERKAELERKQAEELAAKERAEAEAKLKTEREEREKAELELQAKREAEQKAEAERQEQEKARLEAEEKAKAAPEKEKLTAYLNFIARVDVPVVKSKAASKIATDMQHDLEGFLSRYKDLVSKL